MFYENIGDVPEELKTQTHPMQVPFIDDGPSIKLSFSSGIKSLG